MQSNPYGFEYKGYSAAESIATTVCEELGLYDIETGDNTLKSTLNLVLAIVPDDVKEILEPIIEQMDDEVDTVVCATDSSDQIKNVDVSEILNLQKEVLANPIKNTLNWVVDSVLSINPLGDYKTPMSNFMPFAPYIESNGKLIGKIEGYHFASQPMKSDLSVQTVIGTNANETNSFGMLPSLTFLIPTILELVLEQQPDIADVDDPIVIASAMHEWLNDKHNQQYLINSLNTIDIEEASTQQSLTAYGAVTQLFFGLSNLSESGALLNLTDFYPNSEAALGGATANMKQFKTMLNDTVFDGPARHMATNSTKGTTLYRFDKKPSFNMWNYNTGEDGSLDILDLFKTIGCISGACNGSELPFMFNKAVRFDGSEIHPNTGEKALMNEMSRLWFSEELFTDYQYSDSADNVLVIEAEGFSETTTYDWDYVTNPGVDPKLRQGRLTGLEEQGLMPWQWYLN
ncbi:carboxylesterase family protein [Vibrio breoganii]|nr:carboxylesterase family protein [Vibrio breoganii]